VTVNVVNDPGPTAAPISVTTALFLPVTINVLSAVTPTGAPIDPTTLVIATQPSQGSATLNPNHTITYSPPLLGASVTFTYTIADTLGVTTTGVIHVN
jgi:hypothetical protein